MESIFLILSLSAVTVLGGDAMVVNVPWSNNWEIGMTMDMNFRGTHSPFTEDTMSVFQDDWNTKKLNGNYDALGSFEMTTRLVQSQQDKLDAIGVEGDLEVSFAMFSGDARMSFAKDNVDSALDVSLIVKAHAYGQSSLMTITDHNKLRLKATVDADDLNEFKNIYGSYMIVGFEYGGEIMYTSTHTVLKEEDKLAVAGALSMSYQKAAFSVQGSVSGNYDASDISKSYTSTNEMLIRPNMNDEVLYDLIYDLGQLSLGNPIAETFPTLSASAQSVLSGYKLDPIKAILIPLETVGAVHDKFVSQDAWEDSVEFMVFLNEMFLEVKALEKQIDTVEDNYNHYAANGETIPHVVFIWEYILNLFLIEMRQLNTRQEIIDKATLYNAVQQNVAWNADVLSAKSFIEITTRGLATQFDDAVMDPYNAMIASAQTQEASSFPPFQPMKGSVLTYIDIEDNMHIEMDVVVHSFPSGWANIFHCGGADVVRMPGIWIGPASTTGMGFHTVFGNTANWNYHANTGESMVTGKAYHWELDITQGSFKVTVDGVVSREETGLAAHSKPGNLVCYASDPWYEAADVTISNLMVSASADQSAQEVLSGPDDLRFPDGPLEVNTPIDFPVWYQMHQDDLIFLLGALLVILCGVYVIAVVRQRQQRRYMRVKCIDSDPGCGVGVENVPINN